MLLCMRRNAIWPAAFFLVCSCASSADAQARTASIDTELLLAGLSYGREEKDPVEPPPIPAGLSAAGRFETIPSEAISKERSHVQSPDDAEHGR